MHVCVCVWGGEGGGGGVGEGRADGSQNQSPGYIRVHHFLPPVHFLALDNAPVSVREQS